MSCRTGCCKKLSLVFALLALVIVAAPAFAQSCLQDEYNLVTKQKLQCTANDVSVAKVINTRNLDGSAKASCIAGQPFNFIADFLVKTTSSSSRSNVGLYFALGDGKTAPTTALTGACSDNIIAPPHASPNANDKVCLGSGTKDVLLASGLCSGNGTYTELDPQSTNKGPLPDNCGDTSSADGTVCLDSSDRVVSCTGGTATQTFTSTQVVTVEIDNLNCIAPAGTTQLVLPNCTSWQIPGGTIQCLANTTTWQYPGPPPEAIPGSPSKCNCATIPLPITVQSPTVTVGKTCNTNGTTGTPDFTVSPPTPHLCTISPEGGDVTYTVNINNTSNFGDITVDQVCDTAYGTIYRSLSAPTALAACSAGSVGAVTGTNTCTSSTLGDISTSGQCTFVVTQAENVKVFDTVSVSGRGISAGAFGPSNSNQVEVDSNEATATGTLTKALSGTTAGCVTARYSVDVKNTTSTTTTGSIDESLKLTGLTDNTVDLTTVTSPPGLILGTTCGQTAGIGTLTGTSGPGALPFTLAETGATSDYSCLFDSQICGALGTVVTTAGVCSGSTAGSTCTAGNIGGQCTTNAACNLTCNGIEGTDTVSATVTGDEQSGTVSDPVNLAASTITVDQCFPAATQR